MTSHYTSQLGHGKRSAEYRLSNTAYDATIQLQGSARDDRQAGSDAGLAMAARRTTIDCSVEAIVTAGSFISDLTEKMHNYEKIIFVLNKTISDQRSSEETSARRALQAEARAKDAEEQIKRLELREQLALEHLERAMRTVDTSFVSPRRSIQARP